MLIQTNADVNIIEGWYSTAIQAAAARGNRDIVETLIQANADVNIVGMARQSRQPLSIDPFGSPGSVPFKFQLLSSSSSRQVLTQMEPPTIPIVTMNLSKVQFGIHKIFVRVTLFDSCSMLVRRMIVTLIKKWYTPIAI